MTNLNYPNVEDITDVCECTLTEGNRYDTAKIRGYGWTGEHEGYNRWDYFSPDGTYLGADEYGVEPLWDSSSVLEL